MFTSFGSREQALVLNNWWETIQYDIMLWCVATATEIIDPIQPFTSCDLFKTRRCCQGQRLSPRESAPIKKELVTFPFSYSSLVNKHLSSVQQTSIFYFILDQFEFIRFSSFFDRGNGVVVQGNFKLSKLLANVFLRVVM